MLVMSDEAGEVFLAQISSLKIRIFFFTVENSKWHKYHLTFGEADPSTLDGFEQIVVGQHDTNKVINHFKKVIKAQNLTISIAFMGLAIKVIGNLM
mmetsp:Transcript_15638/g.20415  ORF Transcript_15638/g.20415 Transcript_15638/m.20415 type:complete len:96 (+) Transcript_15638:45-332(+)